MLSGNSVRQTVHTHCASVHQPAKLVATLLRVAGVTAGLAKSNGSLPPGFTGSRHLQADCQEPGLAPEPYARQSSMGYLYLLVYAVELVGESCACIYTDCRLYWEWMTFMRPLMSAFSTSLLLWRCCCSIVLTVNVCEPLVRSSLYQRVTERASEWLLNKQ